ncbi:helix-turn-helix domain-containing protein [Slackia exigua]|uniref:helix-turn-helix domain-containing protein n=1 Tax=Slackia exigua TaxID=84109 RepID=UPI0023F51E5D|nr:helix-turn-helix domain-containing protein [Slackia exigua]
MTAAKQTKPWVPLKDFYTIQDVAALIQVSENAVRDLAYREIDPLPFRRLFNRMRGMFISCRELAEWVDRNSGFVSDVVHGDAVGAAEHLREVGGEHAISPDGLEHAHLAVEDPVARVAQKAAEPCVYVFCD